MGKKLSARDQELYKRIDEVLFYLWDPIGVNDAPGARDEYDSYLPHVFSMVNSEKSPGEIAKHLQDIERNSMGLSITDKSIEHDKNIAELLLGHKEWIDSHSD